MQCNPGNTTAGGSTKNWSCNWMVALPGSNFFALFCAKKVAEVESSRTHFEVLGLGLEASSPQKLACPRLEDNTIFWFVKILWSAWKIFWKTFFCGDRPKNFCKDLFFFESTLALVSLLLGLGLELSCPWLRKFLSSKRLSLALALASDCFCSLALASSLVSSTPPLIIWIQNAGTFNYALRYKSVKACSVCLFCSFIYLSYLFFS